MEMDMDVVPPPQPDLTPLAQVAPSLQPSKRWPVLFVGHGSPVNVIEHNVWHLTWRDLGAELLQRYGRP